MKSVPARHSFKMRQKLPGWDHFLVALLFASIALLVFFRIQDFDFFWHIANGKAMVQQGRIINEEIFSYTRPGTPFSNHEWLAQIVFYLIFSNFGALGIVVCKTVIVTLLAVLIFNTARFNGADQLWSGVLTALVIFEGLERYRERPEIFTFLFLGLLAFLLSGYTNGRLKKTFLYAIPVILVLWDFVHGAIYGIVYLLFFVTGETIKHFALKRSGAATADGESGVKLLWIVTGVSLAAMLVNPYGLRTYDIFVEFLRKNPLVMQTAEFSPPSFTGYPAFWLLLALVALLGIFLAKRTDLTLILIVLPFAVLALKYRRVTPFFGLAAVPLLASYLTAVAGKFPPARWLKGLGAALAVLFIGFTLFVKFVAGDNPYSFGYEVNSIVLPVGSTRFIAQSGLRGNMYNPGHFGGYLAYYLYPQRKIFLYNHHVVFGDFPLVFSKPALLEQYGTEYAVLERFWGHSAINSTVFTPERWELVFWDDASLVMVKKNGSNEQFIAQKGLKLFTPAVLDALQDYANKRPLLDGYEAHPATALALAREISSCIRFYENRLLADYLGYLTLRYQADLAPGDALEFIESALTWNRSSAYLWYADSRFRHRTGDPARAEDALKMASSLDKALVASLVRQGW